MHAKKPAWHTGIVVVIAALGLGSLASSGKGTVEAGEGGQAFAAAAEPAGAETLWYVGSPGNGSQEPDQGSNCHCYWENTYCVGHTLYVDCICWINGFPTYRTYAIGSC